jgi:hypothetical protein
MNTYFFLSISGISLRGAFSTITCKQKLLSHHLATHSSDKACIESQERTGIRSANFSRMRCASALRLAAKGR